MKTTYLLRLLRLFLMLCAIGFLLPGQAQPFQLYYEYHNSDDALFIENQGTIAVAVDERDCRRERVDYVTAHTAAIEMNDFKNRLDEEIILTHFVKQLNCKRLQTPEQQVLNIRIPDPLQLNGLNEEEVYSLKVDRDGNVIVVGAYSIMEDSCTSISGPTKRMFILKYDLSNNGILFLKLITGIGPCSTVQNGAQPIDVEILPNGNYLIAMQGAANGGFMIIDRITGTLVNASEYFYGGLTLQFFNPVDAEIVNDKIFAIGHYGGTPLGDAVVLSMDTDLSNPSMIRVKKNASQHLQTHVSAIKYHPEKDALLYAGVSNSSPANMIVGKIDPNLMTVEWVHEFKPTVPFKDVVMEASFGMEYLRGKNDFAIHAFARETSGFDTTGSFRSSETSTDLWYNMIVTIDHQLGTSIGFDRLTETFLPGQENQYSLNNTLVQSHKSDHLAMALGKDINNVSEEDNASIFFTERYYDSYLPPMDCMTPMYHVMIGTFNYGETITPLEINYPVSIQGLDYDDYAPIETNTENRCLNQTLSRASSPLNQIGDLSVLPNPVREIGILRFEALSTSSTLSLYDPLGREVYTIDVPANSTQIDFDASVLKNGIHYWHRSTANQTISTETMLIQH